MKYRGWQGRFRGNTKFRLQPKGKLMTRRMSLFTKKGRFIQIPYRW